MIIQGKAVNINDKVTFSVFHEYDVAPKVGIFKGESHYSIVREHMDINAYFLNLKHQDIATIYGKNNTPLSERSFLIFETDEGNFLCDEQWIRPLTFSVISNKFIDLRIFNIQDNNDELNLITTIKDAGFTVVKIR